MSQHFPTLGSQAINDDRSVTTYLSGTIKQWLKSRALFISSFSQSALNA